MLPPHPMPSLGSFVFCENKASELSSRCFYASLSAHQATSFPCHMNPHLSLSRPQGISLAFLSKVMAGSSSVAFSSLPEQCRSFQMGFGGLISLSRWEDLCALGVS